MLISLLEIQTECCCLFLIHKQSLQILLIWDFLKFKQRYIVTVTILNLENHLLVFEIEPLHHTLNTIIKREQNKLLIS